MTAAAYTVGRKAGDLRMWTSRIWNRLCLARQKKAETSRHAGRIEQLRCALEECRREIRAAESQFEQSEDPDLVESSIYRLLAIRARHDYLTRCVKQELQTSGSAPQPERIS